MICWLASTAIAVLPAHLQYQAVQGQKIMEFSMEKNCNSKINFSKEFRAEPNLWVQNIHLNKGKTLLSNPPQIIIACIRCIFKRLGCLLPGTQNGGSVDFIRTERTYVCFTADCSKIYNSNIHSVESSSKINPRANGQRSCITIAHKN